MAAPFKTKILEGRFELVISADELKATISPIPEASFFETEKEALLSSIRSHHVTHGILETFREEDDSLVVAEGTAAEDGKDGWIEYLFNRDHSLHITEEHGHVDYRNLGTVASTTKGAPIAKRHLPTRGVDGTTVKGTPIASKAGKMIEFVMGDNVEQSPDGYQLLASIDGCPQVVGHKISVQPGYTVDGDVDYSTGNIEFMGNITIAGMVKPGFSVKAAGDIVIHNGVEEAIIESGGNVTVNAGVLGRGTCSIKATGSIFCVFAEHATLDAGGDIRVKNFLKSCKVTSHEGSVFAEEGKGALMGGTITARKMIRGRILGVELGEKTVFTILGKVEMLRKREQLKKTLKETEAQLDQFYGAADRFTQAFPDPEERAAKMSEVENFLSGKYSEAEKEMKEVEETLSHKDENCIQAIERLHANTEITFALLTTTIQNERGPSHISVSEGRILSLPLSADDLAKKHG
ncbi:MAG: FapA family protein [Nitrospirota bacterium]|nr:FapA family protein [Nitrospirota bacterium]